MLCAVDWIGIGNAGNRVFREALAVAAGTTAVRVAVHTLHQHDAPRCDFNADDLLREYDLGGTAFDPAFARDVIHRAAVAVEEGVANGTPVTHVGIGRGLVEKVASNRRILGPDGKVLHTRWTATVVRDASGSKFWETTTLIVSPTSTCTPESREPESNSMNSRVIGLDFSGGMFLLVTNLF